MGKLPRPFEVILTKPQQSFRMSRLLEPFAVAEGDEAELEIRMIPAVAVAEVANGRAHVVRPCTITFHSSTASSTGKGRFFRLLLVLSQRFKELP